MAILHHLVAQTWRGTLLHEDELLENCISTRDIEVLVGIEPIQPTSQLPSNSPPSDRDYG